MRIPNQQIIGLMDSILIELSKNKGDLLRKDSDMIEDEKDKAEYCIVEFGSEVNIGILINKGEGLRVDTHTIDFIKDGGFKYYFDNMKLEIKLEETERTQRIELGNRQIRFFKYRYFWMVLFALIGAALSLLGSILYQVGKSKGYF